MGHLPPRLHGSVPATSVADSGTQGLLMGAIDMDVIYNIGDAINKIGFGLVIYALAVKDSAKG